MDKNNEYIGDGAKADVCPEAQALQEETTEAARRESEQLESEQLEAERKLLEAKKARKERKKLFYKGMLVGMLSITVVFGLTFLIGWLVLSIQIRNTRQELAEQINNSQSTGGQTDQEKQESVLNQTLVWKMQIIEQMIRQSYYRDEDIDAKEMETGIYDGMIESLGDVYSDYYTPEELQDLMEQTSGIYYGIGAAVSLDTLTTYPKIATVYAGTPAEEAGLRENDIIYEVEGQSTYGLSLDEVVSHIKGNEGTWVTLTIVREGETDYLSIKVQRRKVDIPTVAFEMFDDGMAYIQIAEFNDKTVEQFTNYLDAARSDRMKGLIIDLRSNPGGSLDSVVKICQAILPKGLIVYTEDKYGKRSEYFSEGDKQLEVPLVVLINGNSASASEILAGAVKDYEIGTLVGTKTYGKGIVQSVMPMSDGSAIKLTISSYFTPKGHNIHKIGVAPDVECVFDGEAYYTDPDRPDNQLEEAKRVLQELMKKQ